VECSNLILDLFCTKMKLNHTSLKGNVRENIKFMLLGYVLWSVTGSDVLGEMNHMFAMQVAVHPSIHQ
jgi:hypothetical protein